MRKVCEACSSPGQHEQSQCGRRVRNVLIGSRIVQLCEDHARTALEMNVSDLATLMQLTRTIEERRSPIDRRGPLDRRMFPPRPEGRRHATTRRCNDPQ